MKNSLIVFAVGLLACCTAVAQRLPGGAAPEHYSLAVNLNFATNSFEGDETINLKLTKPDQDDHAERAGDRLPRGHHQHRRADTDRQSLHRSKEGDGDVHG